MSVLALPVALGVLPLSSCSDRAGTTDRAQPTIDISSEQTQAIEDGVVDQAEYDAAFRRYSSCMEQAGYAVAQTGMDGAIIEYAFSADGEGADARCYSLELEQVDVMWQMAHQDGTDNAEWTRVCLEAHGIVPADTMDEMVDQMTEFGLTGADC